MNKSVFLLVSINHLYRSIVSVKSLFILFFLIAPFSEYRVLNYIPSFLMTLIVLSYQIEVKCLRFSYLNIHRGSINNFGAKSVRFPIVLAAIQNFLNFSVSHRKMSKICRHFIIFFHFLINHNKLIVFAHRIQ